MAVKDPEHRAQIAVGRASGRVAKARRRQQMIELFAAGATEQQVADEMGLSRATVSKSLLEYLEQRRDSDLSQVELVRQRQLANLDELQRKVTGELVRVTEEGDESLNLAVVDRILKIEQQRARIAGTEAPQRIEHGGRIQHTFGREEVDRLEQVWVEGSAVEVPDELTDGS